MKTNPRLRIVLSIVMLMTAVLSSAQLATCKDTAAHKRLQAAMWDAAGQDSAKLVYKACTDFLHHAREDGDIEAANSSWVCGIMYILGRMNIHDAYHITQVMKADIDNSKYPEIGKYFISNMLGHVYNTCGNIPGAEEEFLKSIEQIKGTALERDGLPFVYIALAHVHLNNDLDRTLHWLDIAEMYLEKDKDSWNYYRALADVHAIRAIVRFKQKDFDAFRASIGKMNDADAKNQMPQGDLSAPMLVGEPAVVLGGIVLSLSLVGETGIQEDF